MLDRLQAAAALWPVLLFVVVVTAIGLWLDRIYQRQNTTDVDVVVPTQRKAVD